MLANAASTINPVIFVEDDIAEILDQSQYHQEILEQEQSYNQIIGEYLRQKDNLRSNRDFSFAHSSIAYFEYASDSIIEIHIPKPQLLPTGITLYVGGYGPNNYTKIQDAIDDASEGDIVFVYNDSSPYKESVSISKNISLIGEERNSTVIESAHNDTMVISIYSEWAYIKGFTLKNGRCGILIHPYNLNVTCNITINDNSIVNNKEYGIHSLNARHTITNNFISGNQQRGIDLLYTHLSDSNNNIISGNIISKNQEYGIYFGWGSTSNIINNNIIKENKFSGIFIGGAYNTIINNNISGNGGDGIKGDYKNTTIEGNTISNNKLSGIRLLTASNSIVINNNCTENRVDGIVLISADDNIIENNTCLNHMKGIAVRNSFGNLLRKNICNYNEQGILLNYAPFTIITDNDCSYNKIGIFQYGSSVNVISENTCNDCSLGGITLISSDLNFLTLNHINHGWNGLWIEKSFSNLIRKNNIAENNGIGLILMYTVGNRISHNNIYNSIRYDLSGMLCFDYARFNYWGGGVPEIFKKMLVLGWVRLQPPLNNPVDTSTNLRDIDS